MFRPSFEKGSVLKQGMLEALRDYPYKVVELLYADYGDGVISGFEITIVGEEEIIISPGIIKIFGNVYLSTDDLHIKQNDETQYVYVELSRRDNPDGVDYIINLVQSDTEIDDKFELFRYIKNAKLFLLQSIQEVISMPMNRINVVNQKQSVKGGSTLAHSCFILYAKAVLDSINANSKDLAFAYQCLNGINDILVVKQYFKTTNNEEIVKKMRERLVSLNKAEEISIEEPIKRERPRQMIVT